VTFARTDLRPYPLDLLQRAQHGDADAQKQLLEPHWDALARLAYRITGRRDDAEDLAQEICLRVIRRLSTFKGDCAFETWLYRVALNVCLTASKTRQPELWNEEADLVVDPSPSPEAALLRQALQERIRVEILRLPVKYREAVLLRVIEELSYAEVAAVLQISVGSAQVRVHRGMKQLRERLAPWVEGEQRP
jgi:RNA polymerase sigma-70 factor, ECF subfamily